ncbi:MAG: hypothetical protein EOL97_09645 [Spirochaetia bacterium]|nr:hypothetical protein [Spirochaetia bacterium]
MAASDSAINITQLNSEETIPMIYDERMIKALYDSEVVRPLANDKSDMLSGAGDSFNVYTRTGFTTPTSALSDGATIAVTGVVHTPTEVTISYYGDAKQITQQSYDAAFPFVYDGWNEDALKAIGELRDAKGMTELISGASSTVYPFTEAGIHYTSSTVDADARMSYEQILDIRKAMFRNKHKCAYALIEVGQEADLLQDSRFTSIDYVENKSVPNGTVAKGLGIKFITTNSVQTLTENSQTVAEAIFLSEQPDTFIFAEKVAPSFRMGRDSPRDLFESWVYFTAFGFKVVKSNGVVIGKSVI